MKLLKLALLMQAACASAFVVGSNPIRNSQRLPSTSTDEEVENPRLAGLALMLDSGTRKSHSVAQNSAFVSGFFKGLSTRESYRALITSLYFVYTAMEDAFDETAEDLVRALDDPELRRLKPLELDMGYFYGSPWKDVIKPSLATKAYVARVQEVANTKPYLLVAHQYTRYLGDLFGT
jgi:heme oxygenase